MLTFTCGEAAPNLVAEVLEVVDVVERVGEGCLLRGAADEGADAGGSQSSESLCSCSSSTITFRLLR